MDSSYQDMAERSFGYGCWKAPFWFLGPEQGMSKDEKELDIRYSAWRELGSHELDDCPEFHRLINCYKRHGKTGSPSDRPKPRLQATWSKLLVSLQSFKRPSIDKKVRLEHQISEWGTLTGETCVIELSGIAANSHRIKRNDNSFLHKRIERICSNVRSYEPSFVVLYGKGRSENSKAAWEQLTLGSDEISGSSSNDVQIRRSGKTLIAWDPHPIKPRQTNENWETLGTMLCDLQSR